MLENSECLKVKLSGNQLAIYKVEGAKGSWYVMVNQHNEMLINRGFITPMTYMGTSIEDVENFYKRQPKDEHIFDGDFEPCTWLPKEVKIVEK